MELPKRKSIRLKGYDYSRNGAYFVTICTHNCECLFGEIFVGHMLFILKMAKLFGAKGVFYQHFFVQLTS